MSGEVVRTLSVFGIAMDATERELHLLFAGEPGYERSIITRGRGRPFAFVQFDSVGNAEAAKQRKEGVCWDPEYPDEPVRIEFGKRNIRDGPGGAVVKRPRIDSSGHMQMVPVAGSGGRVRTLHIAGLPMGITQELMETFLTANFPCQWSGVVMRGLGDRGRPPLAFVGFHSYEVAAEALKAINGFEWEGSRLRCDWAMRDLNPTGGAAMAPPPMPMISRAPAQMPHSLVPDPDSGKRTLHFTNLPRIADDDFRDWLSDNFSQGDVISHRFAGGDDGRPPVAWVLFATHELAKHWQEAYHGKAWAGSRLRVEMARRELEP
eukprot:TRINITY_DN60996_c0_g1_i1.p1 TRINITY_DN60996_c0_g1~~TRINITY_DN60996_c0_g1_i1.p1  ORF type:complete len:352 (+),score=136.45 TRINITY_DN60996_c0_g1_i1:98-1057(+)